MESAKLKIPLTNGQGGKNFTFFCHAHIGIFLDNDLAVRLSDSRGVIVLVLHHDTL